MCLTVGTGFKTDPWVCRCIEQVSQKDSSQCQGAADGKKSHLQWIITAGKGTQRKRPHAGDGKDVFHDDTARDQRRKEPPEKGDQRDQRIAESVVPEKSVFPCAFGTGGTDEVPPQGLDHAASGVA